MPIHSATLFGTAKATDNYYRNSSSPPQSWRHFGGAPASVLMSLNMGRATPSKWDDAERWITSPVTVSLDHPVRVQHQPQKKPKSKSGPLGHSGTTCYLNCGFGAASNYMAAGSPVFASAGAVFGDAVPVGFGGSPANLPAENGAIARSVSLPGWSESDAAADEHQAEAGKTEESAKEEENSNVASDESRVASSKRDVGTQMSPEMMSPTSLSSSSVLTSEQPSERSGRSELKHVVVDAPANITTTTRPCKKRGAVHANKSSCLSLWDIDDEANNISNACRYQKEEAKIAAWENLQKAKAEAAIRRLEVKLEKKRSSSMEKILGRLRMAQIKAQEMRGSISEGGGNQHRRHQVGKTAHIHHTFNAAASVIKNVQMGLLRGCCTCYAF